MKIQFEKVQWKNLLSYGNELQTYEFKNGVDLINANTGAGKSTVIEAIFFGLFGTPFRKIKKGSLINDINKKKLFVELYFNVDGKGYKVQRGQKPNIFIIYERVQTKDAEEDKIEYFEIPEKATIKEYQDNFEEDILKIDETVFRQLISISSNMASSKPFMELNTKEKEKLFQVITDTSIFNYLSDKIKLRLQDAKINLKEAEYKRSIIDNAIQSESIMIEQAKKQNEDFEKYHQDNIKKTKESIELSRDNIKKYELGIEKLKELKNDYDLLQIDLTSKQQELTNIEIEMRSYNEDESDKIDTLYTKLFKELDDNYYNDNSTQNSSIKDKESEISSLQDKVQDTNTKIKELSISIKNIEAAKKGSIKCKSCKTINYLVDIDESEVQKLDLFIDEKEKLSKKISELKNIIESKKRELISIKEKKKEKYKKDKEDLNKEKAEKVKNLRENQDDYKKEERVTLYNEISIMKNKMDIMREKLLKSKHIKNTLKEHQDNLEFYENKLVELFSVKLIEIDESSLKEKLQQQKEHKKTVQKIMKNTRDLNYLMGMLSDKGENNLKGQIIARTVPFLNKGINYFLEQFSLNEFNFIIDEQFKEKIISRENNTEYNSLSNGQKMRISFSIMFSFLKLIEEKNGVSSNILILDEVMDSSLDALGREELLNIIKKEFSETKDIIIISHNDQIKERTELFNRIVSVKRNKFSSLEIEDI